MSTDTGQSNYSRKGYKRMQEGNAQNQEDPKIKMHLSVNQSADSIQNVHPSTPNLDWFLSVGYSMVLINFLY